MAKDSKSNKRVIKTEQTKTTNVPKKAVRSATSPQTSWLGDRPLIFDRSNYIIMIIGVLVMALGFLLMAGGASEDPNVFDADRIYSFRRITLAPFLLIVGLCLEVYAIFKR